MRRHLFCVTVFFLSIFASAANAAESWHSGKITRVYPLANGSVVLSLDTDAPNCTNTSKPKYLFVQAGQNGMTADGVRNLLAVALAAASQGKSVSINFDDSTNSCFVNRLMTIY